MTRRSLLRGRYLVQNRLWNAWLRGRDAVLDLAPSTDDGLPIAPRRLLLAIGGHLGDALIATSVLRPLKDKWSDLQIGVLSGSWNRQVFAGVSEIQWVHTVDHWKLNRSSDSLISRAARFSASSRSAVKEIRHITYDVAVDLYPYYPNAGALLRRAGVPVRIGYTSGGGGSHYTRRLDWMDAGHVTKDHARLLSVLGVEYSDPAYQPPLIGADVLATIRKALSEAGANAAKYIVFHMGAGNTAKRWHEPHWRKLASAMAGNGISVVVTGSGARDRELAAALKDAVPDVVNVCDQFEWKDFASVLAGAQAIVSVDTAAAHLGAALGKPVVVVTSASDEHLRWMPLGSQVITMTDADADQVLNALEPLLR